MDFFILTLPRSGSHMLASALDSHPDISCSGEYDRPMYSWLGKPEAKIYGAILCPGAVTEQIADDTKMICLTRNYLDIVKSRAARIGPFHFTQPVLLSEPDISVIDEVYEEVQQEANHLQNMVKRFPHIMVDYEELTHGQDIRELPMSIGRSICNFLDVEYHVMRPAFYKPNMTLPRKKQVHASW